jgi:hypothetical protein
VAPFPNPAAPPPSPSPSGGTSPFLLLVALVGLGALLAIAGAVVWAVSRGVGGAGEAAVASASPSAPVSRGKLPPVERHVPHHALSILDGCTDDDVRALASGIDGAIAVGAPLYNAGNFGACYHMYEGTAADVARKLGEPCAGPRRALDAGRARAASLDAPSAQAWAMRDAFDGLVDVIERREGSR